MMHGTMNIESYGLSYADFYDIRNCSIALHSFLCVEIYTIGTNVEEQNVKIPLRLFFRYSSSFNFCGQLLSWVLSKLNKMCIRRAKYHLPLKQNVVGRVA